MGSRAAVIDLGTNTFHLLIAEGTPAGYTEIVHEQTAVRLGEGGINRGFIQTEAFERGINAMLKFHELISKNPVEKVRAIATSALRNAANGPDFIEKVKSLTGIAIETIDGDKEADYIYQGIKIAGCLSDKNSLIVDIGGGSVEFIICNKDEIKWKQSFEIGAARLMDRFHLVDPIPPLSIIALNLYLESNLKDLFTACAGFAIENMIGSSGVFETYAQVIEFNKGRPFDLKQTKNYNFDKSNLLILIEKLILSSHHDRAETKCIIPIRVDMIVTASILTRFVMQKLEISQVLMSTNSLKEGVLVEMLG
jgi:exopolyphosphatase/guanosine-5'-triphosphate,3'-diphosphate pyrophosphatase